MGPWCPRLLFTPGPVSTPGPCICVLLRSRRIGVVQDLHYAVWGHSIPQATAGKTHVPCKPAPDQAVKGKARAMRGAQRPPGTANALPPPTRQSRGMQKALILSVFHLNIPPPQNPACCGSVCLPVNLGYRPSCVAACTASLPLLPPPWSGSG